MKFRIYGKPVIQFTLAPEQLDVLLTLSGLHYDSTCRAASQVGGFLYGWKNQCEWSLETKVSASWRDLDICCKILEIPRYEERVIARILARLFSGALSEVSSASTRWSREFEL